MAVGFLASLVPPLRDAQAQYVLRTAPPIPYAGVAIGDATDSGLLSALSPDPTGADELFTAAVSPHLGASIDEWA